MVRLAILTAVTGGFYPTIPDDVPRLTGASEWRF